MPKLSILEIATLTGKQRLTVRKRLDGLVFEDAGKKGKLYDSKTALEKIYLSANESGQDYISAAEAQRQLTIARRQQIDLEMEVTRGERIPLEQVEAINDKAFSNVAGMLKAHCGKKLTEDAITDMLTELRSVGSALKNGR